MPLLEVLLVAGVLPIGGFIYYYARYSPWRSTLQGRVLMTQKIAMLVLLLHSLLSRALDYRGEEVVQFVILAVLVGLFWAMLAALRVAQLAHRPVPKRRGTGLVPPADLERTNPPKERR